MPFRVYFQMIHFADIRGDEAPVQFVEYAHAYRSAAELLCEEMIRDLARATWPHASVVLMLSTHAVELFLKAAILSRVPTAKTAHHNIYELTDQYNQIFPEPELEWNFPIQVTRAGSTTEELLELVRGSPTHSMLFRYPTDKNGSAWNGMYGFEPRAALVGLQGLNSEFQRLQRHFLPKID